MNEIERAITYLTHQGQAKCFDGFEIFGTTLSLIQLPGFCGFSVARRPAIGFMTIGEPSI